MCLTYCVGTTIQDLYMFSSLKVWSDIHLQTKNSNKCGGKKTFEMPLRFSLVALKLLTDSWFWNINQATLFKKLMPSE